MPYLHGQNSDADSRGHDANQLPAVLSEVQAGNAGEREKTEYGDYQRAGRLGAELYKTQSQ